ncbi:MAG: response regulator [Desulfobacteraceae bacterium]|nr:response regulator [Desulfobacteraceae bacterium]
MDNNESFRKDAAMSLDDSISLLARNEFLQLRGQQLEATKVLGMILRIINTAAGSNSRDILISNIVKILIEESDFENASILLYDAVNDCLRLNKATGFLDVLGDGMDIDYNRNLVFKRGNGLAWQVFESGSPLIIEDCDSFNIPYRASAKIMPGCLVCLPLSDQGVLNLSASQKRTFSEARRRCLIILADFIGYLIHLPPFQGVLDYSHQNLQKLVEARFKNTFDANEELRASMAYMESVINNAPQGICLLDAAGNVTHANRSLFNILGCKPDYLIFAPIKQLFHNASDYEIIKDAIDAKGMARLSDIYLVRADGSFAPSEVFLHPLKDEKAVSNGSMMVVYDLSVQKAAAERMLHSEKIKALGSMAGGVAHNFNNLLTVILGNMELIARDTKEPDTIKRIKNIERAVLDGAHMVRRLSAFNQFGRTGSADFTPADINSTIKDAVELTRPKWKDDCQRRDVIINVSEELGEAGSAAISRTELIEVLTNLIFNAIDAMPNGGSLILRSRKRNKMAVIEVEDTGEGMSDDTKKRMFDPFFSTKGVGNSGLGLSVSYGLIVSNGGDIKVKSQHGKGTVFIISLPSAAVHDPDVVDGEIKSAALRPLKVLLVDDEAELVELLISMLEGQNHSVTGVTKAEEALLLIENKDFDLVITDFGMPIVNGWQIAAAAKKKNPLAAVILLTGWGAEYEGKSLKNLGVDAVICKPFKFDKLLSAMAGLLT